MNARMVMLMALCACVDNGIVAAPVVSRLTEWRFSKDGADAVLVSVPHDWAISSPFDPDAPGGTGKLPWIADGGQCARSDATSPGW